MEIIESSASGIDVHDNLTAAEIGKLWATYMGNSMSQCVLTYFLQHTDDRDIRQLVESALALSKQFAQSCKEILLRAKHPIPAAFSDADVNPKAPRLFSDEFYPHYVKYAAKAGTSIYGIAIPLMTSSDTRQFFSSAMMSTVQLVNRVNELLAAKGQLIKPPEIPVPDRIDFVKKQSYLNGFFGEIRPLQALEITHLYDNIQNNATSKAVLIGFAQVAELQQARDYFLRGKALAAKHYESFAHFLNKEDLPSLPLMDSVVTSSTTSPFSDKLMLYHKLDMFAMRIRSYGNSMAVSARHDLAASYSRSILEVGNYLEDGANIMIDLGYMEQVPEAPDRNALAKK